MKKFMSLLLAMVMVLSLAACGSKEEAPAAKEETKTEAPAAKEEAKKEEPATLMKEPLVLKFACSETEDSIMVVEMKKAFENIAERTNGEITIEVYANNQLGSIADLNEQMLAGAPLLLPLGFDNVGDFIDGFAPASFPYVYSDIYDVYALAKSDWMADMEGKMKDYGVAPLAYAAYGYRHFISTKPIQSAADCEGLIMRMGPSASAQGFITVMGGSPTTSSWADNYSLLQTGVIDSCEASIDLLYSSSLYEVCDYLCLSGHFVTPAVVFMSNTYWDMIPAEYQEVMREELQAAEIAATDEAMAQHDVFVEKFKEAGVTVSEADKESFAAMVPALFEHVGMDPAIADTLQAAIAANK